MHGEIHTKCALLLTDFNEDCIASAKFSSV